MTNKQFKNKEGMPLLFFLPKAYGHALTCINKYPIGKKISCNNKVHKFSKPIMPTCTHTHTHTEYLLVLWKHRNTEHMICTREVIEAQAHAKSSICD